MKMSDDVSSYQHGRPYTIDNIQAFKGLTSKERPSFNTIRPIPTTRTEENNRQRAEYYLQRMRQAIAGIGSVQ
jgi:hypothetical protein